MADKVITEDALNSIIYNLEKGISGMQEMAVVMRDLTDCLEDMTDHYVKLVNCGDCGTWEPEGESEVMAARKMIAEVREGLNGHPADGSKAIE